MAPVLLLARNDHIEHIISGLKAGAVGFVKQTASTKELHDAIVSVAGGNTWCDPKLFRKIMKYLPAFSRSTQPSLTKREEDVLRFLRLGKTNKEVAQHLGLAVQTIKVHVSNLLRKTGATNRSNLALYAQAHGLEATR
jgi:DNA-binding NarL/FixJ family response regulator